MKAKPAIARMALRGPRVMLRVMAVGCLLVIASCSSEAPEPVPTRRVPLTRLEAAPEEARPDCSESVESLLRTLPGVRALRCWPLAPRAGSLAEVSFHEPKPCGSSRPFIVDESKGTLEPIGPSTFEVTVARVSTRSQLIALAGTLGASEPCGFNEDQAFVHDIDAGRLESLGAVPGAVFSLAWSPDESRLAALVVASEEDIGDRYHGDAYILHRKGKRVRRLTTGQAVVSPAWHPSGRVLALGDELAERVLLFDADGAPRAVLELPLHVDEFQPPQIQELTWLDERRLAIYAGHFNGLEVTDGHWFAIDAFVDGEPP